jgi:hypothetical protein
MSKKQNNGAIVGLGVAACAACCAGPILAVLTAIGMGTTAGFALFGTAAVLIGAVAIAVVLLRRRRRASACGVADSSTPVSIVLTPRANSGQ